MMKTMIDVSIVIVCMNNLKNLYPCLESIRKYTSVSYECFVVAYLFSRENLLKVQKDFPWVRFIESNEIRGFSENNNLALRQAKGKYCFVVNDDTEIKMDTIGKLMETINSLPQNTAIVSPKILIGEKEEVLAGKPRFTLATFVMECMGMSDRVYKSKYTFKKGVFQTYNISGAAFLIKTKLFEHIGFFDERYFFCPEDIALSTLLNRLGYKVYVDSNAVIYHYSGGTWSTLIAATKPSSVKGSYYFYCQNNFLKKIFFTFFTSTILFMRMCYWKTFGVKKGKDKAKIMAKANWNAVKAIFSSQTPKQLFVKYYNEIKGQRMISVK